MEPQPPTGERPTVAARDIRVLVGKQIRKLRKNGGLSIEALAHAAGLTPSYLSNVERGTQNPSLVVLSKIARALHVPLTRLVDVENPSPAAMRAAIVKRLDDLEPEQIAGLVKYLDVVE